MLRREHSQQDTTVIFYNLGKAGRVHKDYIIAPHQGSYRESPHFRRRHARGCSAKADTLPSRWPYTRGKQCEVSLRVSVFAYERAPNDDDNDENRIENARAMTVRAH